MAAATQTPATTQASRFPKLKIGLVGCGGRGCGAAKNCVDSSENVELVALADLFPDRMESGNKTLKESLKEKYNVPDKQIFIGFDAIDKILETDIELVLLTTPGGFRPFHIAKAVAAGKHIFAEKPIGTDPVGIRSVLESARKIDEKKLNFVCGTQRRHHPPYVEMMKRIHGGAIGEVLGGQCYWNQVGTWFKPRDKSWSDLEWQIRNWNNFTWLSGDQILEQHVHNIDVMNWAMGGPPVSAYGLGGRQTRDAEIYGNVYDHEAVEFEYPGGKIVMSMCRQMDQTDFRVGERIVGTEGVAFPDKGIIRGKETWKYEGDQNHLVAYVKEHTDLINAIRTGERINEAVRIAESTLTGIMGRMSVYSGKQVTWEQAMGSKLSLFPEKLDFAAKYPIPEIAVPGKTPVT